MRSNYYQDSFNAIIELKEKLDFSSDDSFETLTQYLNSNEELFFKDKNAINRLLLVISSMMNSTPKQIIMYKNLFHFLKNKIGNFFTSDELFNIFKENKASLLFLVEEGLVDIDSLLVCDRHNRDLLFYFAPEIMKRYNKNRLNKIHEIRSYLFEEMNYDEHIKLRSNFCNPSPLTVSIMKDDISLLQEILSRSSDDISAIKIGYSYYEPFKFVNIEMLSKRLTIIEYACFFGSLNIVKYLITNRVNLSKLRGEFAIAGGNPEIIYLLEENGVTSINSIDSLKVAIQFHHNHIVHYLHESQDVQYDICLLETCVLYDNVSILLEILNEIEKKDTDKGAFVSSIKIATSLGNFDLLLFLLDQIDERGFKLDQDLLVDLLNSASSKGFLEIVKYLVNDMHASCTSQKFIGLYEAAEKGQFETFKFLYSLPIINKKYENNVSHDSIETIAAYKGHLDIIKFLHSQGAEFTHKIYNNENALFRAAEGQHFEVLKFLFEFTSAAADKNIVNLSGFNLLTVASQFDSADIIKYLIENQGFDVNCKNSRPLFNAIQNNCVEVLKYFLTLNDCKFEPDEQMGQTPIHWAAFYRIEDALQILIDSKKIDINAKDKSGIFFNFFLILQLFILHLDLLK